MRGRRSRGKGDERGEVEFQRWLSFIKLSSFFSLVRLVFFSLIKPSLSISWPSSSNTFWISSRRGWMYWGRAARSKSVLHAGRF